MRLGVSSLSGVEDSRKRRIPFHQVNPKRPHKLALAAVRSRQRSSLWRDAPLSVCDKSHNAEGFGPQELDAIAGNCLDLKTQDAV